MLENFNSIKKKITASSLVNLFWNYH